MTQKKVEGINFDMRKNLIDYDGVLSGQRELVYRQRDQILLFEDNSNTMIKMCKHFVSDLCANSLNAENEMYVDENKIVQFLNMRLFNANLLKPDFLQKHTVDDAERIITHMLELSVKKRLELLGEKAKNIVKDIMIQNFDYN
jgi:preprotein translocase subunit SecA